MSAQLLEYHHRSGSRVGGWVVEYSGHVFILACSTTHSLDNKVNILLTIAEKLIVLTIGLYCFSRLARPIRWMLGVVVLALLTESIAMYIAQHQQHNAWVMNCYIYGEFLLYLSFFSSLMPPLWKKWAMGGAGVAVIAAFSMQEHWGVFNARGYTALCLYLIILAMGVLFRYIRSRNLPLYSPAVLMAASTVLYFVVQYPLFASYSFMVESYFETGSLLYRYIVSMANYLHYGIIGYVFLLSLTKPLPDVQQQ